MLVSLISTTRILFRHGVSANMAAAPFARRAPALLATRSFSVTRAIMNAAGEEEDSATTTATKTVKTKKTTTKAKANVKAKKPTSAKKSDAKKPTKKKAAKKAVEKKRTSLPLTQTPQSSSVRLILLSPKNSDKD